MASWTLSLASGGASAVAELRACVLAALGQLAGLGQSVGLGLFGGFVGSRQQDEPRRRGADGALGKTGGKEGEGET